jgi:hypothetical protein
VPKPNKEDRVNSIIKNFERGTLRDNDGKPITSKEKMLGLIMQTTGVNKERLEKAELKSKLLQVRKRLENKLQKELDNDVALRQEIIKFFKATPYPTREQLSILAETLKISMPELQNLCNAILTNILNGGLSQGKDYEVDPEQLAKGTKIEIEHTKDEKMAEKIARDHLVEDSKYYDKLESEGL